MEARVACSLRDPPTDAEAKEKGFRSAKQWWAASVGGALRTPAARASMDASLQLAASARAEGEAQALAE
eukprot:12356565-Alexandrium_andersonii.AAC.1